MNFMSVILLFLHFEQLRFREQFGLNKCFNFSHKRFNLFIEFISNNRPAAASGNKLAK